MSVTLWIDTMTGTYGNVDDLRIVEVSEEAAESLDTGWYSDSEIIEIGLNTGGTVLEWS